MFKTTQQIATLTVDILKGANATIWGGVKEAEKVGTIVKGGLCLGDSFIGVGHAVEDISCGDYVCATLDVVGSVSSALSIVLGNIPSTKGLTTVTGILTIGCRTARYHCKKYGTFWGCTVAVGHGLKESFKVPIKEMIKDMVSAKDLIK